MAIQKKTGAAAVSGLLSGLARAKGWELQLDLHSFFPRWQELAGEEFGRHARPLKIERNVLWLEVENSAWMQQFQYQKLELLDVINGALRLGRLTDIKMTLPKGHERPPPEEPPPVRFSRPDGDSLAAFKKQAECIGDEKCREALVQFWYLAQACKRNDT